jgi:hypothetical protein
MNNKNRRRRNNQTKKQKKLVRCKVLNRPMFDHEVCSQFSSKISSNTQKNCENCIHSF